jgi:hypothetical protein
MQRQPNRPDPHCSFRDDKERGKTLRTRHRWNAVAIVAAAAMAHSPMGAETWAWLTGLLAGAP